MKTLLSAIAITLALAGNSQPTQAEPPSPFDLKPHERVQQRRMHQVIRSQGRLGAQVISMSEDLRTFFGAPKHLGLLVDSVLPKTPAHKAGLRSGDVIVGVEGKDVAAVFDIQRALQPKSSGDKVSIEVIRNKKRVKLSAQLTNDAFGPSFGPGQPFSRDPEDFDRFFGPGGPWEDLQRAFPNLDRERGHRFRWRGGSDRDLEETLRKLEERLERLEKGGKATPKKSTGKSSGPKS